MTGSCYSWGLEYPPKVQVLKAYFLGWCYWEVEELLGGGA
jgi:hypothetical protein